MKNDIRTKEELHRIDLLLEDVETPTERIRLELEWLEMRGPVDEESEAA
jgi:hypothetical protein